MITLVHKHVKAVKSGQQCPKEFKTTLASKLLPSSFKDMAHTRRMVEDRKKLKRICGEDMEKLCRRLFCKN